MHGTFLKHTLMSEPGTQCFWVLPHPFYRLSNKNSPNCSRYDSSVLTLTFEEWVAKSEVHQLLLQPMQSSRVQCSLSQDRPKGSPPVHCSLHTGGITPILRADPCFLFSFIIFFTFIFFFLFFNQGAEGQPPFRQEEVVALQASAVLETT